MKPDDIATKTVEMSPIQQGYPTIQQTYPVQMQQAYPQYPVPPMQMQPHYPVPPVQYYAHQQGIYASPPLYAQSPPIPERQ